MFLPLSHKSARKFNLQPLFLGFFLSFFLSGCATYKIPTESFGSVSHETFEDPLSVQFERKALQHPLYSIIPRHRSQIRGYDLGHWCMWMLFGNDDDGIFGEGPKALYKLEVPNNFSKALSWTCRNPLHNFCFYVIGSAYKPQSEFALLKMDNTAFSLFRYKRKAEGNYRKGSFFFIGFHGWKPFIFLRLLYSQKYKGQCYLGWRERGNFGIMFLPFTTIKLDD
jgi:hypothetical protein